MTLTTARKVLGVLLLLLLGYLIFWKLPEFVAVFFNQIVYYTDWLLNWMWPFPIAGRTLGYWGAWFVVFFLIGALSRALAAIPELLLILLLGFVTVGPFYTYPPIGGRTRSEMRTLGESLALFLGFMLTVVLLLTFFVHYGLGPPGLIVAGMAHGAGAYVHQVRHLGARGLIAGVAVLLFLIFGAEAVSLGNWIGTHQAQASYLNMHLADALVGWGVLIGIFFFLGAKLGVFKGRHAWWGVAVVVVLSVLTVIRLL